MKLVNKTHKKYGEIVRIKNVFVWCDFVTKIDYTNSIITYTETQERRKKCPKKKPNRKYDTKQENNAHEECSEQFLFFSAFCILHGFISCSLCVLHDQHIHFPENVVNFVKWGLKWSYEKIIEIFRALNL